MLAELALLSTVVVTLLSIVGAVPVALLLPDLGGVKFLFSPFAGLALLYFVCQWLSPLMASSGIVIDTCAVSALLACLIAWRQRRSWMSNPSRMGADLWIVVVGGLLITFSLQIPMLHRGVFTLANFSGDDLFTWTPTAYYMAHHAYAAGQPLAYVSPLLWVLPTNIYPGSAGTVDGGLAALLHMQPYQFVEPFTAICLALGAVGVYLLVRLALRLPRWTALLAMALAATSQNRFVVAGFGFAQSSRGAVLMIGSLALFVIAIREESWRAGALSGAMAAVLTAVYMPLFLVVAASMLGGVAIAVTTALVRRTPKWPWTPVAALAGGGLVIGAANIRWLFFGGGLHAWSLQTSYGTELWFVHYPFNYLVGMAPFETLYRAAGDLPLSLYKPLFWNSVWGAISNWIAILVLLLLGGGLLAMVMLKRWLELACLLVPMLYGVGVYFATNGGFGGFQSVLYLTPIGCMIAAYGAYGFSMLARRRSVARSSSMARQEMVVSLRSSVLAVVVLVVLVFQVAATVEMEAFFVEQPGMIPATNLKLSAIASEIPKGASVLMYPSDGANGAATERNTANLTAAAYFLPDRNVTIEGHYFAGAYLPSEGATIRYLLTRRYSYVLHVDDPQIGDPPVTADYRVVWRFQPDNLVLYRRR